MITSLTLLALAIACYSLSQLQQHGKLRWSKKGMGFWDYDSDKRKYYSKIPFAKTWLVFLTDGYHFCQFMAANFLSVAFTFALGFGWWMLLIIWSLIHAVHFVVYRIAQK